jgi:hypothetical protein
MSGACATRLHHRWVGIMDSFPYVVVLVWWWCDGRIRYNNFPVCSFICLFVLFVLLSKSFLWDHICVSWIGCDGHIHNAWCGMFKTYYMVDIGVNGCVSDGWVVKHSTFGKLLKKISLFIPGPKNLPNSTRNVLFSLLWGICLQCQKIY